MYFSHSCARTQRKICMGVRMRKDSGRDEMKMEMRKTVDLFVARSYLRNNLETSEKVIAHTCAHAREHVYMHARMIM